MKRTLALTTLLFTSLSALGAEYTCGTPHWTQGPGVSAGTYRGTVALECRLRQGAGGTLNELEEALSQDVLDEAKAVHAGPLPTSLNGLDGTYFDATQTMTLDDMVADIRADLYLVTDGNQFLSRTLSKSVSATGMAKNLKKADIDVVVTPDAADADWYDAKFSLKVEVAKPGLVPVGIFQSKVTEGMEDQIETRGEQILLRIAETL